MVCQEPCLFGVSTCEHRYHIGCLAYFGALSADFKSCRSCLYCHVDFPVSFVRLVQRQVKKIRFTSDLQEKKTLAPFYHLGIRMCPKCKQGIQRTGGCNLMTCTCGEEFFHDGPVYYDHEHDEKDDYDDDDDHEDEDDFQHDDFANVNFTLFTPSLSCPTWTQMRNHVTRRFRRWLNSPILFIDVAVMIAFFGAVGTCLDKWQHAC